MKYFPSRMQFRTPGREYERLILSAFLHIGLFHLFMNMYFLYSMGPLIESMWGGPRFLAIYLIATIVSGCVDSFL